MAKRKKVRKGQREIDKEGGRPAKSSWSNFGRVSGTSLPSRSYRRLKRSHTGSGVKSIERIKVL